MLVELIVDWFLDSCFLLFFCINYLGTNTCNVLKMWRWYSLGGTVNTEDDQEIRQNEQDDSNKNRMQFNSAMFEDVHWGMNMNNCYELKAYTNQGRELECIRCFPSYSEPPFDMARGKPNMILSASQVIPIEVGMFYCLDIMCSWKFIGNTVSHVQERGNLPETAAEKGYEGENLKRNQNFLGLSSLRRSLIWEVKEKIPERKKVANKQGKATYKTILTGGSGNERDSNVTGVRQWR